MTQSKYLMDALKVRIFFYLLLPCILIYVLASCVTPKKKKRKVDDPFAADKAINEATPEYSK
jgi:hypothetical protein